jgi:hypothetical protein
MSADEKILGAPARSLRTLTIVNTAMWTLALIGLVLVIQRAPSAKGMFVIIAVGLGVSAQLMSVVGKARRKP